MNHIKEYEKIDQANKKGIPPEPPVNTLSICNKDGKKVKDITTMEAFLTGASLSSDGKHVLISYFNNLEEQTYSIATIDMESQNITVLLQDSKISMREPEYSKDKSGFYFLANKDKQMKINDKNVNAVTINFYDISEKKLTEIWSQEGGEPVNFYIEK